MRVLFVIHLFMLAVLMVACQPFAATNNVPPFVTQMVTSTPFIPTMLPPSHKFMLTPVDPSQANSYWLDEVRITLQYRLRAELTADVMVMLESNQLVIEVENDVDAVTAREILSQPHSIIFFDADLPLAEGIPVPSGIMALMSGAQIIAAQAEPLPSGEWHVSMQLTSVGDRILDTFCAANNGRFMMIAQDGLVIRSLVIRWHEPQATSGLYVFDTQIDIRGELTESSAKVLATQLNSSQLPIEMSLSEIK